MAAGVTNKGKFRIASCVFRGGTIPTNFYMALVTSATAPTVDINTLSELTEIANGQGYITGGYQLTPGATDFDVLTEDDSGDQAILQIKNIVWTASGGSLPASGSGARYAVLLDDNATVGSREVWAWWDLESDRTVSDTQSLTVSDAQIDFTTP